MDSLIAAKRWYDTVAVPYKQGENGAKQLFVKLYPHPKGTKPPIAFLKEGTPELIWEEVAFLVNSQSAYQNAFDLTVCSALKDEGMSYKIIYYPTNNGNQQQGQMAGIGSVPGVYGYSNPADIGKIIEEKVAAVQKDWEHKDELRKKDEEIARLEYEAKERKKNKADFWERATEFCRENELDLNPIINGFAGKMFSKRLQATPGLAGLRHPRPEAADIHRTHATGEVPSDTEPIQEIDPEDPNIIAMNESVYKELLYQGEQDQALLSLDYAAVIDATIRLAKFLTKVQAMGMGKGLVATDLLVTVADFVIEKPLEAQQLVKQMRGDTNTEA